MKTTYLINKTQPDGSIALSVATPAEWAELLCANKGLPVEQQRHFILDHIADGNDLDCMVIEVSAEEYVKWDRERKATSRNRKAGRQFQILSLDMPVTERENAPSLSETIPSGQQLVEDSVCDAMLISELRVALADWRPWGNDMLDMYLRGSRRGCTPILAQKYGVSAQVIRKYKRQFEAFIKNFLKVFRFDPHFVQ